MYQLYGLFYTQNLSKYLLAETIDIDENKTQITDIINNRFIRCINSGGIFGVHTCKYIFPFLVDFFFNLARFNRTRALTTGQQLPINSTLELHCIV